MQIHKHITCVDIYLYGRASVLGPECAVFLLCVCVCLCVCMYVCVCVFVISNQNTNKKPHMSDLSKSDALLPKTHSKAGNVDP